MSDWIDFYDFKHSVIYVNARHRDVHYRTIAQDIRAYVPSPTAHVLDYGCGEATSAELVAAACGQLVLAEAAPNVRASLTMHYAADPKITVISAEQAAALPKASFDLIVMHSVAQYLSDTELERLLADGVVELAVVARVDRRERRLGDLRGQHRVRVAPADAGATLRAATLPAYLRGVGIGDVLPGCALPGAVYAISISHARP